MQTVLELRSLSKLYAAGPQALDNVSLALRRGELFALIGPSGCGKTTLLRTIAGFEQPDSGDIWLDGHRINDVPPHLRDVTTVFQNYALFPHLTVERNVAFGLAHRPHVSADDARARVGEMLEMLQLTGKQNRLPKQLSGGERQRVALARSLVLRPAVLLLDEPLSALDPRLRRHVRTELKELQAHLGVTFLFVTHDQEEALALSDRIGVMNAGRLLQVGPGEEIYRAPATAFTAEFLGDVNWMGARCALRPESVCIGHSPLPESERCRSAQIVQVEFLGSRLRIKARLDSGELCTAEMVANGSSPRMHERVFLTWQAGDEMHPSADA